MEELEVEVVGDLSAENTPEYVLYGGKGGVGKTTMAAATGVASARAGIETLVVSTDPAHNLADVYETELGVEPVAVPGESGLYGVEIDPDAALEEATLFDEGGDLAVGGLGDMFGGGDEQSVPMPGADEAASVQQLLRFLDDDRFDRVVIDTAPTGQTLRLLDLPEFLDSMLGRILKLREQLSNLGGVFGDGDDGPGLKETSERLDHLASVLRDPSRTDFRLVMVPEDLSVRETTRLRERLHALDIPVGTLVVNRVMEPPGDVADVPAESVVAPDLASCEFCSRRWQVQQAALEDAQDLFRGVDVYRVPLLAASVADRDALEVVASCLE